MWLTRLMPRPVDNDLKIRAAPVAERLTSEQLECCKLKSPTFIGTNPSIHFTPDDRKEPPTPKKTPIKEPKKRKKPIGDPPPQSEKALRQFRIRYAISLAHSVDS